MNKKFTYWALLGFLFAGAAFANTTLDAASIQQVFKVALAPNGSEVLISEINISPADLARLRAKHPGVPRGDVEACLTDRAIFGAKYVRVTDLRELAPAPAGRGERQSEYGNLTSFPLHVMPKTGEKFLAKSRNRGTADQPWAVCRATGELEWFAFAFENLELRVVNSEEILPAMTLEVMALKNLTTEEIETLKVEQAGAFTRAQTMNTAQGWLMFVLKYQYADIGHQVPAAQAVHKRMVAEANAPALAEQARKQAEQYRLNQEASDRVAQALAAFRKTIQPGTETNCGPVLEIKGDLAKVYAPVATYGTEHWLRRDRLFQQGLDCRFRDGVYIGR